MLIVGADGPVAVTCPISAVRLSAKLVRIVYSVDFLTETYHDFLYNF